MKRRTFASLTLFPLLLAACGGGEPGPSDPPEVVPPEEHAEALAAMKAAGLAPPAPLEALERAWKLQQDLTQLLKVALEDDMDPTVEPPAFRALLARAGGARDFRTLSARLTASRAAARKAYETLVTA